MANTFTPTGGFASGIAAGFAAGMAVGAAQRPSIPDFTKVDRFNLSRWVSRAGWITLEELLAGKDPEQLGFGARISLALAMGAEESAHGTGTRWAIAFETDGDRIILRQSTPAGSAINTVGALSLWDLRIAAVRCGLGQKLGLLE